MVPSRIIVRAFDFPGDRRCVRLTYGGRFEIFEGSTLTSITPEYKIPDMYLREDKAFIESISSGVKDRSNIDSVLESAKLIDSLYRSAEIKREIIL